MVIKNNITAMNANRMFNLTNTNQVKSTEKLSSGYKINRSADDAAGLSISEKMRRQVRGLTQASANATDGISCVQTAEGALNEIHDMLQRMGELSVKATNETLTLSDREYITMEVRQLMNEIDRVHSTTTFNEQNLLDGSFKNKELQVGTEAGQHITVSIGSMGSNDLIASALSKAIFFRTSMNSPLCAGTDAPPPVGAPLLPGEIGYWVPANTTYAKKQYWNEDTVAPWGTWGHTHLLGACDLTLFHSFSYNSIADEDIKNRLTTDQNTNASGGTEEALSENDPDVRYFYALNVFTKSAISDVSRTRSDLGAIQNRLEHTINNLDNIAENTVAAESAIRDTDMATEMVKYSNNSILAQAGQAVLAQANQGGQGVLALL